MYCCVFTRPEPPAEPEADADAEAEKPAEDVGKPAEDAAEAKVPEEEPKEDPAVKFYRFQKFELDLTVSLRHNTFHFCSLGRLGFAELAAKAEYSVTTISAPSLLTILDFVPVLDPNFEISTSENGTRQ